MYTHHVMLFALLFIAQSFPLYSCRDLLKDLSVMISNYRLAVFMLLKYFVMTNNFPKVKINHLVYNVCVVLLPTVYQACCYVFSPIGMIWMSLKKKHSLNGRKISLNSILEKAKHCFKLVVHQVLFLSKYHSFRSLVGHRIILGLTSERIDYNSLANVTHLRGQS